jgi:UDP-GlcNAc3NAcA epimerase
MTVIGARPQFIKAATVSRLLSSDDLDEIDEVIVHTGQHYDHNMSQSFFQELNIPAPEYNLEVGSGTHGQQTGAIMTGLEGVVEIERPDWVLVYGDTNSTLAGALVAAKLPCRLAHVEAGLRSCRWGMPEEVNRVVTDRLSDLLFCPTTTAKKNLALEGREQHVIMTGDIMYDSFLYYKEAADHEAVMRDLLLSAGQYLLVTVHRAENTDDSENLEMIISALRLISREIEVVLPLHPRTKKRIAELSLSLDGIRVIDPVPYLTMIVLIVHAKAVVTDSGGLQKEAYFAKVPCLTIRDETEWVETLEYGWNQLIPLNAEAEVLLAIRRVLSLDRSALPYHHYYGLGDAAKRVVDSILAF